MLSKLYNVRKLIQVSLSILLKLGKCDEKHAISTHQKMAANMESLLVSLLCKNESEIEFLIVASSWGCQHGFSAETFLVTQPTFMMV